MARSPESERVAEAIRAVMKSRNLSGADLARAIEKIRGTRPHPMWVTKRAHGDVHLVKPKTVTWEATADLELIAQALGVPVGELVKPANQNGRPVLGPPCTCAQASDTGHDSECLRADYARGNR